MIKRLLRISSWTFYNFLVELSLHSLSDTVREFLEHSSIKESKAKDGQEIKGKQRSRKE